MGSLYTEAMPEIGAVRIVLDIRDFYAVGTDDCQLLRSTGVPGTPEFGALAVRVRPHPTYDLSSVFPSIGFPWEMTSGGVEVWYDTEAPFGVPLYYQLEIPGAEVTVGVDASFLYSQAAVVLLDTGFEAGVSGWTADAGGAVAANTTSPIAGTGSLRITSAGGTAVIGARSAMTAAATIVPGREYAIEATLRAGAAEGDVRLAVDWFTAGAGANGSSNATAQTLAAGVVQRRRHVFTAPALSSRLQVRVRWAGTPAAARTVDVDDVRLVDLGDALGTPTGVVLNPTTAGWLSDPELPAGDIRLDLLPADDCTTPAGVVFVSNGSDQTSAAGARFDVIDQRAPTVITAKRKLPTSTLTVAALAFADRDRLHELLATGDVLMLRLVAEYGLADRYLDVGDVATNALSPDLRLPYRVLDMPYQEASSPAGPIGGVLGTRFQDLDRYDTWADFDAANLTSIDLLLGAGSTVGLGA
jgi:hypothetical protein